MHLLPQERCRQEFVAGSDGNSNQTTCHSCRSVRQSWELLASVTSETRIVAIMRWQAASDVVYFV